MSLENAYNYSPLFKFIRYVQPVWYFNLQSKTPAAYWVDFRKLSPHDKEIIEFDQDYATESASLRDAAYQAWHKGVMTFDVSKKLETSDFTTLADEYRFLRKYFHPVWSIYVLLLRLILLRNPFLELGAFIRNIKTKRINTAKRVKQWTSYDDFTPKAKDTSPLVSIIVPTLNRYPYLIDVLRDLERQDHPNLEVIVVDQSDPYDAQFYDGWSLNLVVVRQQEKALWKARNDAILLAHGEYILLYDDDSRVDSNWVSEHLKCIEFFDADFSAGVSLSVTGAKIPDNYAYFRWADQIDTGNVLIKKDVFRRIGLFDRQFERQRMGDGEFGLRAYLSGCRGVSNPYASRVHLKVESGGLRQMGSWDGFRPTSWFAPRPIPSVLYLTRRYFGNKYALFDLLIKVPASILPLRYKRSPLLLFLASCISVFLFPVVVIQVLRSWNRASRMIAEGPKIQLWPINKLTI